MNARMLPGHCHARVSYFLNRLTGITEQSKEENGSPSQACSNSGLHSLYLSRKHALAFHTRCVTSFGDAAVFVVVVVAV